MAVDHPYFVTATLWEYLEPLDRGDRYEDPLIEALESRELGTVTGGGTQLSDTSGIEFIDIELELANLGEALDIAKSVLEKQGAAKGSVFRFTQDGEVETVGFGVNECVAVFLDGVSLPDEVYAASDINDLAEKMTAALGELGNIRGAWTGQTETAVFVSGTDAEEIANALQPVLDTYPLCQNARIVVRHGEKADNPREFRVPRRS